MSPQHAHIVTDLNCLDFELEEVGKRGGEEEREEEGKKKEEKKRESKIIYIYIYIITLKLQ